MISTGSLFTDGNHGEGPFNALRIVIDSCNMRLHKIVSHITGHFRVQEPHCSEETVLCCLGCRSIIELQVLLLLQVQELLGKREPDARLVAFLLARDVSHLEGMGSIVVLKAISQ